MFLYCTSSVVVLVTGNVTQTTAQNGSAFLRYTYDPFGNVTSINAPMTVDIDDLNRYTYNGEDYDCNTGLQYLRARYYSTGTGSFISQDTYLGSTFNGLSLNRYTYVGNMPTMFNDPSGHIWAWAAGALIGGIVGAVSGAVGEVVSAVVEGRDIEVGKVLQSTVSGALGGATTGAVFAMTGNATLAGAAGGAVSGATNGVFREINDAREENRSIDLGNLAANVFDGAVSGGIGGAVGGAVGGKMVSSLGTPILAPAGQGYSLSLSQSILTGISSSIAGGSAGRFTQTLFSNIRNPENAVCPFAAALDPRAVLTDAILGGTAGTVTHLLTDGQYITRPIKQNSNVAENSSNNEDNKPHNGLERAQKYGSNWTEASLSEVVDDLAPDAVPYINENGKLIYANPDTGIQIVYDIEGNYFRIQDTFMSGKRVYLDLNGNKLPNNVTNCDGTMSGMSKGEYNQLTHFTNIDADFPYDSE